MASTKTLRKLFALFLSAGMVLSLAACAGNKETTHSDNGNSSPSSEQQSNENSDLQETEGSTSSASQHRRNRIKARASEVSE